MGSILGIDGCIDVPRQYGRLPCGWRVTDPTGLVSDRDRVYRGGTWNYPAKWVRSALRLPDFWGHRDNQLGFRPVLSSVR